MPEFDSIDSGEPDVGTDPFIEEDPMLSGSQSSGRRLHLYAEEIRKQWNFNKILKVFHSEHACIVFCEERGLIPRTKNCPRHRSPMPVITQGQVGAFRCGKGSCRRKSFSRAKDTWFENAKLSLTVIFQVMYMFCQSFSYEQVRKETATGELDHVLSTKTIAQWYNCCR